MAGSDARQDSGAFAAAGHTITLFDFCGASENGTVSQASIEVKNWRLFVHQTARLPI